MPSTIEKSIDVSVPSTAATTSGRSSRSSRGSWKASRRSASSTTRACTGRPMIGRQGAGVGRRDHRADARRAHRLAQPRGGARTRASSRSTASTATRTRITLQIDYDPEGVVENVGDALGVVSRRVEGDLRRFKEFIESRGSETGAWRGEIHQEGLDPARMIRLDEPPGRAL